MSSWLKVPLPFLFQKIYSTSHRLEPMIGLEVTKPPVVVVPDRKEIRTFGGMVLNRDNRMVVIENFDGQKDLDKFPWKVRYFHMGSYSQGVKLLACRFCGVENTFSSPCDRCLQEINQIWDALLDRGKCVVCKSEFKRHEIQAFARLPVCSENCFEAIHWYNPMDYDNLVREEKRKRGKRAL